MFEMTSFLPLDMWTKWELEELEGTLRDITLEDVLTEEEIMVIKENSTRYKNLTSSIMVPKKGLNNVSIVFNVL